MESNGFPIKKNNLASFSASPGKDKVEADPNNIQKVSSAKVDNFSTNDQEYQSKDELRKDTKTIDQPHNTNTKFTRVMQQTVAESVSNTKNEASNLSEHSDEDKTEEYNTWKHKSFLLWLKSLSYQTQYDPELVEKENNIYKNDRNEIGSDFSTTDKERLKQNLYLKLFKDDKNDYQNEDKLEECTSGILKDELILNEDCILLEEANHNKAATTEKLTENIYLILMNYYKINRRRKLLQDDPFPRSIINQTKNKYGITLYSISEEEEDNERWSEINNTTLDSSLEKDVEQRFGNKFNIDLLTDSFERKNKDNQKELNKILDCSQKTSKTFTKRITKEKKSHLHRKSELFKDRLKVTNNIYGKSSSNIDKDLKLASHPMLDNIKYYNDCMWNYNNDLIYNSDCDADDEEEEEGDSVNISNYMFNIDVSQDTELTSSTDTMNNKQVLKPNELIKDNEKVNKIISDNNTQDEKKEIGYKNPKTKLIAKNKETASAKTDVEKKCGFWSIFKCARKNKNKILTAQNNQYQTFKSYSAEEQKLHIEVDKKTVETVALEKMQQTRRIVRSHHPLFVSIKGNVYLLLHKYKTVKKLTNPYPFRPLHMITLYLKRHFRKASINNGGTQVEERNYPPNSIQKELFAKRLDMVKAINARHDILCHPNNVNDKKNKMKKKVVKICRVCGKCCSKLVSTGFNAVVKITAVYLPIIVREGDTLPLGICKKCDYSLEQLCKFVHSFLIGRVDQNLPKCFACAKERDLAFIDTLTIKSLLLKIPLTLQRSNVAELSNGKYKFLCTSCETMLTLFRTLREDIWKTNEIFAKKPDEVFDPDLNTATEIEEIDTETEGPQAMFMNSSFYYINDNVPFGFLDYTKLPRFEEYNSVSLRDRSDETIDYVDTNNPQPSTSGVSRINQKEKTEESLADYYQYLYYNSDSST